MFVPELHWVTELEPHRLALMAAPRGGEWLTEEVAAWHTAGVNTVVSLLEPFEVRELELELEGETELEGEISPVRKIYPDAMMEHLAHMAAVVPPPSPHPAGFPLSCTAGLRAGPPPTGDAAGPCRDRGSHRWP